ncbi:MAG: ribonuclease HII [Candidatus Aenigmarchaeota archaeon]|nr:ribonuclease HII [Candidatus Aenigmarchaeota archaeon]
MEGIIAGIDEAGRGAVVGPMIIAGVSVREKDINKLKKINVKDSKELSQKRRVELKKKIEKIAKDIIVLKVSPCRIDDYNKQGVNLNKLEAMKMAHIIDILSPEKVYVDAPEANTEKFSNFLNKLTKGDVEIIAENYADSKYPIVSAASIIAKVEREKAVAELKKKYGLEGSGYPSDERTIKWLKKYLEEHGKFPEKGLVRFSWDTTKHILGEKKQSKILKFFKKSKN